MNVKASLKPYSACLPIQTRTGSLNPKLDTTNCKVEVFMVSSTQEKMQNKVVV